MCNIRKANYRAVSVLFLLIIVSSLILYRYSLAAEKRDALEAGGGVRANMTFNIQSIKVKFTPGEMIIIKSSLKKAYMLSVFLNHTTTAFPAI